MTESSTEPTAPRVSWDVFFIGEHGFGEHLQVVASDSGPIIEGRAKLLNWLTTVGAKPQPRDITFASKAAPAPRAAEPMLAAASAVLGAAVGRTCSIHNFAMKRIAGTAETGKLSRNGKSYQAFWVCEAAEGCRGE